MLFRLTVPALLLSVVAADAQVDVPLPETRPLVVEPAPVEDDLSIGIGEDGAVVPSVRRGKERLLERCGGCHAVGAYGQSPNPESPPFREVMTRYPASSLEESLAEGITTGHPDMPQFVLDPPEIADVVAYLDALAVVTEQ